MPEFLPGHWLLSCLPGEVWQRHPRRGAGSAFPGRPELGEMRVDRVQQLGLASLACQRETLPTLTHARSLALSPVCCPDLINITENYTPHSGMLLLP